MLAAGEPTPVSRAATPDAVATRQRIAAYVRSDAFRVGVTRLVPVYAFTFIRVSGSAFSVAQRISEAILLCLLELQPLHVSEGQTGNEQADLRATGSSDEACTSLLSLLRQTAFGHSRDGSRFVMMTRGLCLVARTSMLRACVADGALY
jgi:hypothetical protein